jgi:uncharacterized protein YodC (DUF2158 family)
MLEGKFKTGDIVCMVGTTMKMTVRAVIQSVDTQPFYKCLWFDREDHLQDKVFPEETLYHCLYPEPN